VALGQFKLRLLGKVLKEQGETLLMRPQYGPDVEISKTKVLAIEECAGARLKYSLFGEKVSLLSQAE
jgi:hypothetical protein